MWGISPIQTLITFHCLHKAGSVKILFQIGLSSQWLWHLLCLLSSQALAANCSWECKLVPSQETLKRRGERRGAGEGGGDRQTRFGIVLCPLFAGIQQLNGKNRPNARLLVADVYNTVPLRFKATTDSMVRGRKRKRGLAIPPKEGRPDERHHAARVHSANTGVILRVQGNEHEARSGSAHPLCLRGIYTPRVTRLTTVFTKRFSAQWRHHSVLLSYFPDLRTHVRPRSGAVIRSVVVPVSLNSVWSHFLANSLSRWASGWVGLRVPSRHLSPWSTVTKRRKPCTNTGKRTYEI